MLLRGKRLGDISGDVLEFISSREADRRIFAADLLVDRAHLVMLREQGLISQEESSKIIAALDGLDESKLGEGEDIHEAIEAQIISSLGNIGGRMHTGRSRNDEVATCIRIALRGEMLEIMEELSGLIETLLTAAGEHTETLIPGFTHLQHAQPTTLAHHLLAHADAFRRDLSRLMDTYSRVNLSPLGAAAFASTGFNIDRKRTCDLLGFKGLVENSMDAVSSRDFILEAVSDLAILMVNLSRLAEELILWSTSEFGYAELDNRYASTSSIMPQKKNPDTAELTRGKAGSVIGSLVSVMTICKALPMSYNRDLQEVTPHLWRSMDWARGSVRIIDGCISTLDLDLERLERSAGAGFSTATELADSLVRITGMPFRTAHQIVGKIASANQSPTLQDLDRAGMEVAGVAPSNMGYRSEDLLRALDPMSNVIVRSRIGGPAPSEVRRMLSSRRDLAAGDRQRVAEMRAKVDEALSSLKGLK
jgi:argininosuccinate lyase